MLVYLTVLCFRLDAAIASTALVHFPSAPPPLPLPLPLPPPRSSSRIADSSTNTRSAFTTFPPPPVTFCPSHSVFLYLSFCLFLSCFFMISFLPIFVLLKSKVLSSYSLGHFGLRHQLFRHRSRRALRQRISPCEKTRPWAVMVRV